MNEQKPHIQSGRSITALLLLLAACWSVVCVVAQQPRITPHQLSNPAPVVGVSLRWNKGKPPETTVSNLTTGTFIYAGLADAVMFTGLALGSTNRFLAFNTSGSTPVMSAVAVTQDLRCSISVYTYLVTVPIKTNSLTAIMTSTNLITWKQIMQIHCLARSNSKRSSFF